MLLEVIVQSVEDALAAKRGGADRLEVVREIERDGLTPPLQVVRDIQAATGLPLRVMVRESDGFAVRDPQELGQLQRAFAGLAALRVDGAVVGYARHGCLDVETMQRLLAAAPELPVTLHRAFDSLDDRMTAIHEALQLPQIDRILSDGGGGDWTVRCEAYRRYAERAGPRLVILAGGGVDEQGLHALASNGCVREAHVGRAARVPATWSAPVSAEQVRRLKEVASGGR